jgi:arylsulfatase A-like enzyme
MIRTSLAAAVVVALSTGPLPRPASAGQPATSRPTAARHPNIVVILADDAGWGDFSFVGNTNLATPAIDGLARAGGVLEQFCVQPVCAPTRAELLTGRYHPRSGVRGVSLGQERMHADERTLADILAAAGYATGCFGKWHNGTQWPLHPRARGFGTFYGFTEGHWGDYYDAEMELDGRFVKGSGYIADDITDKAIAFVERSAGGPFLCYVAYNTPHSPMCVPDAEWDRFRDRDLRLRGPAEEPEFTRAALAMVENLDRNVGRILATLAARGLDRDSIVVFFSDNGPNNGRWCGGMRGRKGSTDDGGVRSVCCIRLPGRIAPGTRITEVTGAIDLLPTLCGLAGVVIPPGKPLDGVDLSSALEGAAATPGGDRAVVSFWGNKVSVRSTRHRLDADGRLYDMAADPGQTRDVAESEPAEAARLRKIAAAWRRDVGGGPPGAAAPFSVGFPGAPNTELPARDGVGGGGVVRSGKAPNCSFFTGWTSRDDTIAWDVDVLTPGRYDALLWCTCPVADAGATIELSCGLATTRGTITPGWDPPLERDDDRVSRGAESYVKEFRPLALGPIDLAAGPGRLVLRATAIPGRSVADVRRLVLVPVSTPSR